MVGLELYDMTINASNKQLRKNRITALWAFVFTLGTLCIGYMAFGFWTMMVFASGFLGGFALWLIVPTRAIWNDIKIPYWISLALFVVHRVEEKTMGFFDRLAEITKISTPEILSLPVILLVLASVGAWLMVPYLVRKGYGFGYYLAWTFFSALGITELAHFIFPLFKEEPYGYFPGMASVVLLAPVAWWGMYRLNQGANSSKT